MCRQRDEKQPPSLPACPTEKCSSPFRPGIPKMPRPVPPPSPPAAVIQHRPRHPSLSFIPTSPPPSALQCNCHHPPCHCCHPRHSPEHHHHDNMTITKRESSSSGPQDQVLSTKKKDGFAPELQRAENKRQRQEIEDKGEKEGNKGEWAEIFVPGGGQKIGSG